MDSATASIFGLVAGVAVLSRLTRLKILVQQVFQECQVSRLEISIRGLSTYFSDEEGKIAQVSGLV